MTKPVVFLDRDGTIIEDAHYLADPDGVVLLPEAVEGLRLFQDAGYALVIVSNQSGIGRGYFADTDADAVNARMADMLAKEKIALDGIFYCPHTEKDECACRKPLTGLIDQAVDALGLSLEKTIVIGDKQSDIELGKAIQAQTVLVRTGKGAATEKEGHSVQADAIVNTLREAADIYIGPSSDEKGHPRS